MMGHPNMQENVVLSVNVGMGAPNMLLLNVYLLKRIACSRVLKSDSRIIWSEDRICFVCPKESFCLHHVY